MGPSQQGRTTKPRRCPESKRRVTQPWMCWQQRRKSRGRDSRVQPDSEEANRQAQRSDKELSLQEVRMRWFRLLRGTGKGKGGDTLGKL